VLKKSESALRVWSVQEFGQVSRVGLGSKSLAQDLEVWVRSRVRVEVDSWVSFSRIRHSHATTTPTANVVEQHPEVKRTDML
jgi:hypothetical protein